jgi:hypothetical protein
MHDHAAGHAQDDVVPPQLQPDGDADCNQDWFSDASPLIFAGFEQSQDLAPASFAARRGGRMDQGARETMIDSPDDWLQAETGAKTVSRRPS